MRGFSVSKDFPLDQFAEFRTKTSHAGQQATGVAHAPRAFERTENLPCFSYSNPSIGPIKWLLSTCFRGTDVVIGIFWKGLRQLVARALRLPPRGGLGGDTLRLRHVSGRLEVEWQARDVHPWDRSLPVERQAQCFTDQTFTDADRAIKRLFELMPELDAITVRVLAPGNGRRPVLAGTVTRTDLDASPSSSSPRMRLWMLGLQYEVHERGARA